MSKIQKTGKNNIYASLSPEQRERVKEKKLERWILDEHGRKHYKQNSPKSIISRLVMHFPGILNENNGSFYL